MPTNIKNLDTIITGKRGGWDGGWEVGNQQKPIFSLYYTTETPFWYRQMILPMSSYYRVSSKTSMQFFLSLQTHSTNVYPQTSPYLCFKFNCIFLV